MAEDLVGNLANYKLQLQQVEAALTTDPDNDDLVKLRNDLQEVINLTLDLVNGGTRALKQPAGDEDSEESDDEQGAPDTLEFDDETRTWLSTDWKAGDKCRAIWSEDQQYYAATIDEILDDGTCSVVFEKYGSTEVTKVSLLRPWDEQDAANADGPSDPKKPKTKKDLSRAQREYKKKKSQKKAQRLKQMEDEREQDKNKWIQFNAKVFSKTNKGKVKKSIFASPDTTSGRVGVGTCGVSGRPMTKFTYMEKWKK